MSKTTTLLCLLFVGTAATLLAAEATPAKPAAAAPKAAAAPAAAQPAAAGTPAAPAASTEDRASYFIGLNLGKSLSQNHVTCNQDLVAKGLRDGLAGAQPMFTEAEMQSAMQELQQRVMAEQQAAAKAAGETNQKEAEAFLAKNKTAKGVTTTASGLQYEVIKQGTGPKPKATDTVSVHYRGTLLNGTEFDSSYKRNEPASFVLNQVIPGWTEGVQLMNVGSKYKFYVPPVLAYGERGAGNGLIGPNTLLVFEVELLEIKPGEAAPAAEPEKPTKPAPTPTPSPGR
jgi:FKBP-type peptidyl-prolyl cis-trans isomerase